MRAFHDLLETVEAAAPTTAARNLTTLASVRTATQSADPDPPDSLITALIPRATQLIVDGCRLAVDGAGSVPTFAKETLRATWFATCERRGRDLYLPWRLPVSSIDSVTEGGVELVDGTDFVRMSSMAGRLVRMSGDAPTDWSSSKIVVECKAGFTIPEASTLAAVIASSAPDIEAAVIEQVKAMMHASERDPAVRSESAADIGSISYALPGGDMYKGVLLPQVVASLSKYINPTL